MVYDDRFVFFPTKDVPFDTTAEINDPALRNVRFEFVQAECGPNWNRICTVR